MPEERQLTLDEVIADVEAGLEAFPVRVRAWMKKSAITSLLEGREPFYTLNIVGDAEEYTEVTIGCPEGWAVEASAGGAAELIDTAGIVHLPHLAVAAGLVKIAGAAPFPDWDATRKSKERWGGK